MKVIDIIPPKKEFIFLVKTILAIAGCAVLSLIIIFLFLSKPLDTSYKNAFQAISEILPKMNFYIITAILIQLIIASIIIILVAIFYSHKIAGPVYRLKMILSGYLAGEEIKDVKFRSTDFIPGVSKFFNEFFKSQKKRKELIEEGIGIVKQLERGSKDNQDVLKEKLSRIIRTLEGNNAEI